MKMALTSKSVLAPSGELLTWDTEFWGMRIGRGGATDLDAWAKENTIGCMCLLLEAADVDGIKRAQDGGARLTDFRVKLERPTDPVAAVARPFRPEDVEGIVAIARKAFRGVTRFYADPKFPDDRCDDLYETWLRSSCAGWAAQVFVIENSDAPIGFITVHVDDNVASIGLVAVDDDLRRRGAGEDLVNAAVNWAYSQGVPEMTVVTQGRNIQAQRVFQKCGFRTRSLEVWMHRWYQ